MHFFEKKNQNCLYNIFEKTFLKFLKFFDGFSK